MPEPHEQTPNPAVDPMPGAPTEPYAWLFNGDLNPAPIANAQFPDAISTMDPAAQSNINSARPIAGEAPITPAPVETPRTHGKLVLAGISVFGAIALTASLGTSYLRDPGSGASASLRNRSVAGALPGPAYTDSIVPPTTATTEQLSTTSTTTAPRPTSTTAPAVRPSTPNVSAPAPVVSPEVKSAEKLLTADDLAAVDASGYEGLIALKNKMEITARFDNAVIVGVEGAKLNPEQVKTMRAQIAAAEAVAANEGSFTSHMKLGPTTERDITYDVSPATEKTHYFFIYDGDITQLSTKENVSDFPNEFTKRTGDISATVIKKQPADGNVYGYDAQSYYNGVGVFQAFLDASISKTSEAMILADTKGKVDMSYLPSTDSYLNTLGKIGRELANNGGNLAWSGARYGKSPYAQGNPQNYETTRRQVMALGLEMARYSKLEAHYPDPNQLIGLDLWMQWHNAA